MIRDLFRLTGYVSRQRYLAVGVALFALKYTLDMSLTRVVFHRPWGWFPYLDPIGEFHSLTRIVSHRPWSWFPGLDLLGFQGLMVAGWYFALRCSPSHCLSSGSERS